MTQQINILPPYGGGPGTPGSNQGHRPKRRRKNRDQRKKETEKKKEKEAETKMQIYRKALFQITLFSWPLAIIMYYSTVGLTKLFFWVLQQIVKGF